MQRIDLIGRCGIVTSALEHIEGNLFRYVILNNLSFRTSEINGDYIFVDPSDGPILNVGGNIDGREILLIKRDDDGFIVELSDKSS